MIVNEPGNTCGLRLGFAADESGTGPYFALTT